MSFYTTVITISVLLELTFLVGQIKTVEVRPFSVSEDEHNEAISQSETSHGHGAACGKEMSIIRKRLSSFPIIGSSREFMSLRHIHAKRCKSSCYTMEME